ncbi:Mitochondrial genome maintenance protein MGM101 [Talaromyces islandicus]|uniref:Mitochondrial genome maintenance protein MGM101 n=1 Tax=Talaromyces islandicus TaxID=28573 RepID=A0A0U1M6Y4_TALIS|nr:Mitochondrial genome maintenance protein MGM101 [Talaromyces islandicus]
MSSSLALRRSFVALELLGTQSSRQSVSTFRWQRAYPGGVLASRSQTTSSATKPAAAASSTATSTSKPTSPSYSPSSTLSSTTNRADAIKQPTPRHPTTSNLAQTGLSDAPLDLSQETSNTHENKVDWSRSFHGISDKPFPKEAADVLLAPTIDDDVEIKPDGIVYLPEIKYRRILNRAFGPGGWGLVPRSESIVTPKTVTREYALICNGRLVSIARGEQDYFNPDGIPTATEGCKSNALVRCCKDLGIASELWDPRWIRRFKATRAKEVFVEHVVSKKRTKIWIRKDEEVAYPWKPTNTSK